MFVKHLLVNGGPGLRGIDSFTGAQMLEELNDSTSSTCSGAWMSYTDGYTVTVHSRERNEMLAEMIGKPSGKMGGSVSLDRFGCGEREEQSERREHSLRSKVWTWCYQWW